MILKIAGCDKFINFQNNSLNVLFIPEINELFNFISLFRKEIEEETEVLTFFDSDKKLKLDSEVDLQTDLFSLTLNQKKLITWLHKKILKENSNSETMFNFNKVKETILSWLNELKTSTLIDFDYLEDLENTKIGYLNSSHISALFEDNGSNVYLFKNGIAVKTPIKIGELRETDKISVVNILLMYIL